MKLNKEIADALCTAITMGFVINNSTKKHDNQKTRFIYEKADDKPKHNDVADLFKQYEVEIAFEQQTDTLPKVILAMSERDMSGRKSPDGLAGQINLFEQLINKEKKPNKMLYGAYIGGAFKSGQSQLELVTPSLLKVYNAKYRERADASVNKDFEKAKEVTDTLKELIPSLTAHGHEILGAKMREQASEVTKRDEQLFGSQHGMVGAMIHYYPPYEVDCIELALSEDTNKVASCVPCSIFMSANKCAASYTHFGRGDYWNLQEGHALTKNWENEVIGHYNMAFKKLGSEPGSIKLRRMFADINAIKDIKELPAIFLEALTFEGSFIDKIKSTLQ